MAQLTRGMYGNEFNRTGTVFGLRCGQMRYRPDKITHNSGWYNKLGEKLGWGDLGASDFKRIAKELEDGELFIILGESDSFWNFVTQIGPIGSMLKTTPTIEAPGIDYVASHARFVIAQGKLYFVDDFCSSKQGVLEMYGLEFTVLRGGHDVKKLMETVGE